MMVAAMAIVAALTVAVASVGTLYSARVQAQIASDAAALVAAVATYPAAGSAPPSAAAQAAVAENGARLVVCRCPRNGSLTRRAVSVVAAIDVRVPIFGVLSVKGSSRAEFDPRAWLGR